MLLKKINKKKNKHKPINQSKNNFKADQHHCDVFDDIFSRIIFLI